MCIVRIAFNVARLSQRTENAGKVCRTANKKRISVQLIAMEAKTEGHVVDRANLRLRRSIGRYSAVRVGGRARWVVSWWLLINQRPAAVRRELSLNEHRLPYDDRSRHLARSSRSPHAMELFHR